MIGQQPECGETEYVLASHTHFADPSLDLVADGRLIFTASTRTVALVNIRSLPLGLLEIVINVKSSVKTGVAYTEVLQVQIVDCLNEDQDITVSNA